jgi:hypothetical protein
MTNEKSEIYNPHYDNVKNLDVNDERQSKDAQPLAVELS